MNNIIIIIEVLLLWLVIVLGFVGVGMATNPQENQNTIGFKIMAIAFLMAAGVVVFTYILMK